VSPTRAQRPTEIGTPRPTRLPASQPRHGPETAPAARRYWNRGRQRYCRSLVRYCSTLRVSADRAANRAAHTRGKPRLLDVGRRIPARDKFAPDSLLEGNGFELPVRGAMNLVFAPLGYWLRPSEIAPIIFVRHSLSDARIPTTKPRFVVGARAVIRSFVTVIDRRTVSGACYPPKRPLGIAQIPGRRPT